MPKPLDRRARNREHDRHRRKAKPWRAFYGTARWQAMRDQQLGLEPRCERCLSQGVLTRATVVHHIKRHEGDDALFYDPANLASSCQPHHDATEQAIEARGYEHGVTVEGRPVAADHPWNRKPA